MVRHRLTYGQVRAIMETPQDVMDFAATITEITAERERALG